MTLSYGTRRRRRQKLVGDGSRGRAAVSSCDGPRNRRRRRRSAAVPAAEDGRPRPSPADGRPGIAAALPCVWAAGGGAWLALPALLVGIEADREALLRAVGHSVCL